MQRARPLPSVPLWAWPTVLALDAPLVAVAWQAGCAAALGVVLRPAEVLVLALSVWLAYSADRLLDALRLAPLGSGAAPADAPRRHAFAARRRWGLGAAWLLLLGIDVALAATLGARALRFGWGLLALVLIYLALAHLPGLRRALPRWVGAVQVGILFAGGAALFPLAAALGEGGLEPLPLLPPLALFGALCCANVLLIGGWEAGLEDGRAAGRRSGVRGGRALAALATAAAGGLLLADLASGTTARFALDVALLAAGALLLALAAAERVPTAQRRVLADAALLTPLPVLALAGLLNGVVGG